MSREFKSYDLIALQAGLTCGLALPPLAEAAELSDERRHDLVGQVADDPQAAALRDSLVMEFDRRLRDEQGYTLRQLAEWFSASYAPISVSALHRARVNAIANRTSIARDAEIAKAFAEVAADSGADALLDAGTRRAAQIIFQVLMEVDAAALDGKANLDKVANLLGVLAKLQHSKAQSELLKGKVAEMTRKFEDEMRVAQRKAAGGGKGITDEMIAQVRQAVFGKAVA